MRSATARFSLSHGEGGIDLEGAAEAGRGLLGVELLEEGHAEVVLSTSLLAAREGVGTRGAGEERREEKGAPFHCRPVFVEGAPASVTIPCPSLIMMVRSAATPAAWSVLPLGQATSTLAALVAPPRPKVTGSSLWER